MVDGFAKTPRYVLKDGSHPTCPSILQASSDAQSTAIFGFSGKPEYDVFLQASLIALTPYPLVKRFLEDQVSHNITSLKLIVLDAASHRQEILYAATFESVLTSLKLGLDSVELSYQLVLDEPSGAYEIEPHFVANARI